MSRVIWKYPLAPADEQTIQMPQGAYVMPVQIQDDAPCLWALVDPSKPVESHVIRIIGTGNPCGDYPGRYIGTVQLDGLVWHVFDTVYLPL